MLTREHVRSGQIIRLFVERGITGWDVREEHDDQVAFQTSYTDWHRVERALRRFELNESAVPGPRRDPQ